MVMVCPMGILTVKLNFGGYPPLTMPPKGYVSITVPRALATRLKRMKRAQRLGSVAECIEYLLKFTVW